MEINKINSQPQFQSPLHPHYWLALVPAHSSTIQLPAYLTAEHHILQDSNLQSLLWGPQIAQTSLQSPHEATQQLLGMPIVCAFHTAQSTALHTSTISKPNTGSLFYLPTVPCCYPTLAVSWVIYVNMTKEPKGNGNWMLPNKITTLYITNA